MHPNISCHSETLHGVLTRHSTFVGNNPKELMIEPSFLPPHISSASFSHPHTPYPPLHLRHTHTHTCTRWNKSVYLSVSARYITEISCRRLLCVTCCMITLFLFVCFNDIFFFKFLKLQPIMKLEAANSVLKLVPRYGRCAHCIAVSCGTPNVAALGLWASRHTQAPRHWGLA